MENEKWKMENEKFKIQKKNTKSVFSVSQNEFADIRDCEKLI